MEKKNKTILRLLIPVVVLLAAIYIAKSGYETGHWLYNIIHK